MSQIVNTDVNKRCFVFGKNILRRLLKETPLAYKLIKHNFKEGVWMEVPHNAEKASY